MASIESKNLVDKRLRSNCKAKSYDSRKRQLSDLLTVYWTFLDNYPAKSDIKGLIDKTGCWKLTFIICYSKFRLERIYCLQTSETFET